MTVEEIKSSDKTYLTAGDICRILRSDEHTIREVARTSPDKLGFKVTVINRRVLIPRIPFLQFIGELK